MRRLTSIALAFVAGCEPSGPVLEVEWTGADTGQATLAASARRCADGPLELVAVSGDTGVAIGFFGEGAGQAGSYQIREPGTGAGRGATLGARWLDSAAVKAFRASDGTVTITSSSPELAGRFSAQARQPGDARQVTISGTFRRVTVGGCGG